MTVRFEHSPNPADRPPVAPAGGIRMRYFLRLPNVGDRVSPFLVTTLTGEQTRFDRDTEKPHLLGVGSLMATACPASLVWGTGPAAIVKHLCGARQAVRRGSPASRSAHPRCAAWRSSSARS